MLKKKILPFHRNISAFTLIFFLSINFFSIFLSKQGFCLQSFAKPKSIAILGDSINLGRFAHPKLTYNFKEIWQLINETQQLQTSKEEELILKKLDLNPSSLGKPVVLWQSKREYRGSLDWIFRHLLKSLNLLYLDFPQYSWGFLTARALGVPAHKIFIAAQPESNLSNLPRQIDKLLSTLEGSLPDTIFVLLSEAELCHSHPSLIISSQTYEQKLTEFLKYLVKNLDNQRKTSESSKTQVILFSHFGISQILSNQSIQEKTVSAHGEFVSCKDLFARHFQPEDPKKISQLPPESLYLSQIFPQNPSQRCPTLYGQRNIANAEIGFFASFNQKDKSNKIISSSEKQTSDIAGKIRSFRLATEAAISTLNLWTASHKKNVDFVYINSHDKMQLTSTDISNDCFNLSLQGQFKITENIYETLQSKILK